MKIVIPKGATSRILTVFIQDSSSTTGAGLGSLTNASSIVGGFVREGATGVALAVDEDVTTEGTYQAPSAQGKVRIGTPANMRTGTYELHFHNNLWATGAETVTITLGGASDMAPLNIEVQLSDPVRGLGSPTALPNAAADAAGGLPISDAGGFDVDNRAPAAAAITNMNTVFNTDFATNYNTTNDGWVVKLGNYAHAGSAATLTLDAAQINGGFNIGDLSIGGTLTVTTNAMAWNAAWDAEVQSEVSDEFTARGYTSARAGYLDNINNANLANVPAFPSNFAALGINASGHVSRVVLADTVTTLTNKTGFALASTGLDLVTAWTVDITGSLSGSVGSVAGSVGSVTGNVGGNVSGSVGSVTGAVGSVTGNVGGNVVGTVASVVTKTGYSLAATGLDLVVPADPSSIPVLGTASIVTWLGYFGAWTVNEVNSDSNSVDLRNSADNANLASHPTSDDGTTFSSGEPA